MIYDNVDIHAGYSTARIKTKMLDQSLFLQVYGGYRLMLEPNSLAKAVSPLLQWVGGCGQGDKKKSTSL